MHIDLPRRAGLQCLLFLGLGTLGLFLFAQSILESALLSQAYVSAASWERLVQLVGGRAIPGDFGSVSIPLVSPLAAVVLLYSLFKWFAGAAWIARRRRIRFAEAAILWGDRGWRWWLILKAHGFDVGFGRVFLVNYSGIFFNHLLPGGVGGDATKALMVAEGEDRKAALVGTVLLDRVVGLAVLVLLGAVCLIPFAGRFASPLVPGAVFGAAGGMLLGYLAYVNPALRRRFA